MKRLIDYLKSNESLNRFIEDNRGQLKKLIIVASLIVVALGVYAFGAEKKPPEITEDSSTVESQETETGTIYVDIGGSVVRPMLAELPEGSRVEDAIQAAGGLAEDADLTNINRAEFLEDGQKIYIPVVSSGNVSVDLQGSGGTVSSGNASSGSQASGMDPAGKVNINYADSSQLQTLDGVGPVTARKIIDYRESSGPFKSIEDLKNVSGIGDKTFDKLKDKIST